MNVGNMKKLLIALVAMVFATGAFAQSGYQIRAGDTLQIEVLEDPSLNRSVLVLPDGTISFPFAGAVRAAGQTTGAVDAAITAGIASNFASEPNVFVTVASLTRRSTGTSSARIDIYMLGEISSPGEKEPPSTFRGRLCFSPGPKSN